VRAVRRFPSLRGRGFLFLLFIWFIWFMNFNGRTLFSPILPLIEDEFGVTHAQAASIFTFISGGYGLALFSSGMVSGFLGSKRTILASLVTAGCIFFIIPTKHTFILFYPVVFVLAFALGLYLPTIIPMITEYYEEAVWGKVIAIHESASSLSIFGAPFIALFFLSFLTWRDIFIVVGSISLLCAVAFQLAATDVSFGEGRRTFHGGLLKKRAFWIMGTLWIFASGCILGLYFVLPLYLVKELGMTVQKANSIFGLSRLGMVLVAVAAGFLVDRVRLKKALFLVVLVTGLLTMCLAVKEIRWIKFLLFVQATISGAFPPLMLVAISRMFDRETRGQATGFVVTLGMVGTGIIPYLIGLCGDLSSFRLGIFVLGLSTVLASSLLYFLRELH
jgi:MFS transporter, NNP family, nitrate/nitrite transporter